MNRMHAWWLFWMRMKRQPLTALLGVLAAIAVIYTIGYPLSVTRYPPITDLPFHAAMASIVRHYAEPSWGFQEQFSLHFLESPYAGLYVLGALFNLVLPIAIAMKLAIFVLLAQLPIGLGLLARGARKSPYLGLLALPLVWTKLTHWGFINFVGAIGLMAAALGLALHVLDRGRRKDAVWLAIVLVFVFSTHVFRYPFTILAILLATLFCYPATRRALPVLLALIPSGILATVWFFVRPKELSTQGSVLAYHKERVDELASTFFGTYSGGQEEALGKQSLYALLVCAVLALVFRSVLRDRARGMPRRALFDVGSTLSVLAAAAVAGVMFMTLPMEMGVGWWYIYPREAITCAFLLLGLAPDLPRRTWARVVCLAPVAYAAGAQAFLVATHYWDNHQDGEQLAQVIQALPRAPKLGYMVWDRAEVGRTDSPYLHTPAWAQAERGGWLSWHFASWNVLPIRYRKGPGAIVPPGTPVRFEWQPELFDLATRGRFFDWMLVRSSREPNFAIRPDSGFELRTHAGPYWLYARKGNQR